MNKKLFIIITAFIFAVLFPKNVMAGDEACTNPDYPVCYPTRAINEYTCSVPNGITTCYNTVTGDHIISTKSLACDNQPYKDLYCQDLGGSSNWACGTLWFYPDGTPTYEGAQKCVSTGTVIANCATGAGSCVYNWYNYQTCTVQSSTNGVCGETIANQPFSCCAGGTTPTPSPLPTTVPTAAPTGTPHCTATFNATSYALAPGGSQTLALTVVPVNGSVGSVGFSSSNTNAASVSPASDSSSPYQTTVTAATDGLGLSTNIVGTATMATGQTCSASTTVNVVSSAWWQVIDSDLLTNGGIGSSVPLSYYFDLIGAGGFPGIPIYGGSTNLTNSTVSEKGWLANSNYSSVKTYNSAYFVNLIPSAVSDDTNAILTSSAIDGSALQSGGALYNGYYWYIYDGSTTGPLTVSSAAALGSRKVILIAKNAVINFMDNISLTDGSGFFLAVSSSNINVSATATNMEGIYVADGLFRSGAGSSQLKVRGSVAAYGGVELSRDLGASSNTTTPAEVFEYAPDQEMLFPSVFATRVTKWREVAP